MKSWPSTLPQLVRRGDFQVEAVRPKVSFEPDEGLAIERRKGSVDIDDMACTVYLKTQPVDQLAIFRRFVDDDLDGGVQPFIFRHPLTGGQCVGKIEGDRPYRLQPVSGVEYTASFTLRVTDL